MSDYATTFAAVPLEEVLAAMEQLGCQSILRRKSPQQQT
jgi:hypothetical protein